MSDVRELRAALEKAQARLKPLQAEVETLRASAARVPALEREVETLRAQASRLVGRDRLELLAEVNRLTALVESVQQPARLQELQAELRRLRIEVGAREKKAADAATAEGRRTAEEQSAKLAAEQRRLEKELGEVKLERDQLFATLAEVKAKLKEITTERNQLRAYAPRR